MIISEENPVCRACGGPLYTYDHKKRVHKKAGGIKEWYLIPRMRCADENCECQTLHSALPDNLCANKHYDAGLIEDVVEGVVTSDDSETENYPCEDTMKNWKAWIAGNTTNIDGQLRSFGHRLLEFSVEFLNDSRSLLQELRTRISPGWLKAVSWLFYNHGHRITPLGRLKTTHPLFFAVNGETG